MGRKKGRGPRRQQSDNRSDEYQYAEEDWDDIDPNDPFQMLYHAFCTMPLAAFVTIASAIMYDIVRRQFFPKRCEHQQHQQQSNSFGNMPTEAPKIDPRKVLEVDEDADFDEIKAAYKKKALQYHPDKNNGNPAAQEKFVEIKAAFDELQKKEKFGGDSNMGPSGSDAPPDQEEEEDLEELLKRERMERQNFFEQMKKQEKKMKQEQKKAAKKKKSSKMEKRFSEFEGSAHDIAMLIKTHATSLLMQKLHESEEGVFEDLGRGSIALHFAAFHGNKDTCSLVLSMAGERWFEVIMHKNIDGDMAVDIARHFHGEGHEVTELLQNWTEQAPAAEERWRQENETVIDYWNVGAAVACFLVCIIFGGWIIPCLALVGLVRWFYQAKWLICLAVGAASLAACWIVPYIFSWIWSFGWISFILLLIVSFVLLFRPLGDFWLLVMCMISWEIWTAYGFFVGLICFLVLYNVHAITAAKAIWAVAVKFWTAAEKFETVAEKCNPVSGALGAPVLALEGGKTQDYRWIYGIVGGLVCMAVFGYSFDTTQQSILNWK